MACFLGCFGFSGKRRRRKAANKVLPGDHRFGSYQPLDSSVENLKTSDSQFTTCKIKERSSIKIGKKVSFNLNVQTYEPVTNDETTYGLSESDVEEMMENNGEGLAKGSLSFVSEGDSTVLRMGSFPSNHRYQNCRDSYDDEDDMAYIESDLDNDGDDEFEDDDENDIDDQRVSQNEFLKRLNYQSVESPETNKLNNHMQLPASTDGEWKRNTRDRSQYVNSVLNPVENLTQWKAVKARTAIPKHPTKENIALQQKAQLPFDLKTSCKLYPSLAQTHDQSKPLLQDIAVDTSLSNWLASPNCNKSKIRNLTSSNSFSVETIPLKKGMFDRSCSQQSIEDRPITDITTLKA